MNGQIARLIASADPADRQTVASVFGADFQRIEQWRGFVRGHLNDRVTSKLHAPLGTWTVESFHALYIACWIHHPVEKGTYMLNLSGLTAAQREVVAEAYRAHCSGRRSSHLSGSGRSASHGWDFLNGYSELLVQMEMTLGQPHILLKAEGHTTGPSGVIPHLKSWNHKRKHGEGIMASPALNALANASALVEERAAENYGKHYKKLLKDVLGFHGKMITVREAMHALFQRTGYPAPPNFHQVMNNAQLSALLLQYCQASRVGGIGTNYRLNHQITEAMIQDLQEVAASLNSDGAREIHRVFREVRATPAEIDNSLTAFCAYTPPPAG